jgi:hypothetical protein
MLPRYGVVEVGAQQHRHDAGLLCQTKRPLDEGCRRRVWWIGYASNPIVSVARRKSRPCAMSDASTT